jgi:hypothetical protein
MSRIDLIPRHAPATIELPGGFTARIEIEHDADMGEPWKEHDGHGPVSDWRALDSKQAGERVLHCDGGRARFYDYAEACKIARRDGWGFTGQYIFADGKKPVMTAAARAMTPKARAAKAADEDFERLRAWCSDEWHWIGTIATVTAPDGTEARHSCWGIESDTDYWREVAAENVDQCLHELADKQRAADVRRCFI